MVLPGASQRFLSEAGDVVRLHYRHRTALIAPRDTMRKESNRYAAVYSRGLTAFSSSDNPSAGGSTIFDQPATNHTFSSRYKSRTNHTGMLLSLRYRFTGVRPSTAEIY